MIDRKQCERLAGLLREAAGVLDEMSKLNAEMPCGILDKSIEHTKFSVRLLNGLRSAGCETIGDVVRKTGSQLLEQRNLGITALEELRKHLDGMGLKLRGD